MSGYGNHYYQPGPCANCGKEGGGFMSSSHWRHGELCCSDACGVRLGKKREAEQMAIRDESKIALRTRIRALERKLKLTAASKALDDVAAERRRQIDNEGWALWHDDEHSAGELAHAGAAYACHAAERRCYDDGAAYAGAPPPPFWPWSRDWWKPKNPRRDLVRAAALLVAEIERLDRQDDVAALAVVPIGDRQHRVAQAAQFLRDGGR